MFPLIFMLLLFSYVYVIIIQLCVFKLASVFYSYFMPGCQFTVNVSKVLVCQLFYVAMILICLLFI